MTLKKNALIFKWPFNNQYPKIKTMQSNLVFPRQYRRTTARRGLCMNNALKSTFITSNVYNYHISQNLTINGVVMDGNWTDFSELYFLCAFLWLVFLVIDILMYHGQTNRVKSRWFESMSHDKWIGTYIVWKMLTRSKNQWIRLFSNLCLEIVKK